MAAQRSNRNDRGLIEILADLFDATGPSTREEAEEELRTTGVDPDAVGLRIKNLANEMLDGAARKGADSSAGRHGYGSRRLAWAIAAGVALCITGWALMRDAAEPDLLQRARERLERNQQQARLDQEAAARGARGEHETAPEQTVDSPAPQTTPAPPTQRIEGAEGPGDIDSEIGRVDTDIPAAPGGVIGFVGGRIPTGETITAQNVEAHSAALAPGLQWAVRNGLRLRIVDAQAVYLPEAYRTATEQYAGQARIAPDGQSLLNYVAGLPFPAIDLKDGQAAMKIMWNYEYRPFATDDLQAQNYTFEAGKLGENGAGMLLERRIVFQALRRLYYNGRLTVEPHPELPNPDRIRFRESLYPIVEPPDLKGVGLSANRFIDLRNTDDTWLFLPDSRRVRRVSAAQRSEALWSQSVDLDSLFGFNGAVSAMRWRLVGEGEVPGCLHAENHPVRWGSGSGDFAFDDAWEMRPVYVVEGTATSSSYAYGKRVLYIDQEAWVVLMSDIYDRKGELEKVWLNMFNARTSAGADDGGPIDNPAAVMADVQQRRVTRITAPNGWTFDQGDAGGVTEDSFKIDSLIDAAH